MSCKNCGHPSRMEWYGRTELPCHVEQNPEDRKRGSWSGLICWCGCKNPEPDIHITTFTHETENTIDMENSHYKRTIGSKKELSNSKIQDKRIIRKTEEG